MALRIEVKSMSTSDYEIKPSGKPGGKDFEPFWKRQQSAYVHGLTDENGAPYDYPDRINLDLGNPNKNPLKAYPVGFYQLSDAIFFVDRFGSLKVGRLELIAESKKD